MNWLSKVVVERHGQRAKRFPGRSLFFSGLLLCGVLFGVQLYCRADGSYVAAFERLLTTDGVNSSFKAAMAALSDALVMPFLLLLIAFFTGLSPCGAVVSCLLPLFYGMSVGLTEAHLYADGWGGMALTAVIVIPRVLMMWTALQSACAECQRMSQLFLAQLRPASAHCGGLQLEFRAYCLRFGIALLWMFLSGIWDVLMRMLCGGWL
ncbi:MAG: hypothetical protein J6K98_03400 [Clostridia bacterium]|nr:hypothetical protein [Clostridia bacterium]